MRNRWGFGFGIDALHSQDLNINDDLRESGTAARLQVEHVPRGGICGGFKIKKIKKKLAGIPNRFCNYMRNPCIIPSPGITAPNNQRK